jgi:glycosyltransferase involved in cell wall biosynthesis
VTELPPKKIAILLPSLKFGGAERVALNLAAAFKELGVSTEFVLMSKEGEFLDEAQTNFSVFDLKCNKTYKLPIKLLIYLYKQRPDVLVSSFWKLNLCACLTKPLFPTVSLLLWEHAPPSMSSNSPKWLYAISASLLYQLANKIVAVSSGVQRDIVHWTIGLSRKLMVIPNAIKPPSPYLAQQFKPSGEKKVIWVGRLDEPKNPGLLLEAFSLVNLKHKLTLTFLGDGPLRPELEKRCNALGLNERVNFLGFRSNPYEEMTGADLLVLSSDWEGFGNVIIEAMHAGLRVVSTDCGQGIHDILLNNEYGTIVPCNEKVLMAKAIEYELTTLHAEQDQIEGAQRYLPRIVAQQFLVAMR